MPRSELYHLAQRLLDRERVPVCRRRRNVGNRIRVLMQIPRYRQWNPVRPLGPLGREQHKRNDRGPGACAVVEHRERRSLRSIGPWTSMTGTSRSTLDRARPFRWPIRTMWPRDADPAAAGPTTGPTAAAPAAIAVCPRSTGGERGRPVGRPTRARAEESARGRAAGHQGERRWGIIGSPHRHALSELAGPARGGHVPPPRRLVGHHGTTRSHAADTRLTGSPVGDARPPRVVNTAVRRVRLQRDRPGPVGAYNRSSAALRGATVISVRLLGPVEVDANGDSVALSRTLERALLGPSGAASRAAGLQRTADRRPLGRPRPPRRGRQPAGARLPPAPDPGRRAPVHRAGRQRLRPRRRGRRRRGHLRPARGPGARHAGDRARRRGARRCCARHSTCGGALRSPGSRHCPSSAPRPPASNAARVGSPR